MTQEICTEATTLPEGATLKLAKVYTLTSKGKQGPVKTLISAIAPNGDTVKMEVAEVAAHALRPYLDLAVREIQKRRQQLTAKPLILGRVTAPTDFAEFVRQMATKGMSILE